MTTKTTTIILVLMLVVTVLAVLARKDEPVAPQAPIISGAVNPTPNPIKTDVTAGSVSTNIADFDFSNKSGQEVKYTGVKIRIFRESGSSSGDVGLIVSDSNGNVVSEDKFSVLASSITGNSSTTANLISIPFVEGGFVMSEKVRSMFSVEIKPSQTSTYKLYVDSLEGESFQ